MVGHYLAEFSISYKPVKNGRPGIGATHSSASHPSEVNGHLAAAAAVCWGARQPCSSGRREPTQQQLQRRREQAQQCGQQQQPWAQQQAPGCCATCASLCVRDACSAGFTARWPGTQLCCLFVLVNIMRLCPEAAVTVSAVCAGLLFTQTVVTSCRRRAKFARCSGVSMPAETGRTLLGHQSARQRRRRQHQRSKGAAAKWQEQGQAWEQA